MAEINLLKTNNGDSDSGYKDRVYKILGWVGTLALLGVVGYYFYLNYQNSQLIKQNQEVALGQDQVKTATIKNEDYDLLLDNQRRVKVTEDLLKKHLDWAGIIKMFSDPTLKTVKFSRFAMKDDGTVIISGTVPDFQELSRMIKGFSMTDLFPYIKEVKLVTVGLAADGDEILVNFSLDVKFDSKMVLQPQLR